MTKKKKFLKRTVALLMALTLLGGFVAPLNAEAATKKVTAKTNFAKSPKIKTGKNYLVTANRYNSGKLYYVQFTAPKKGTYEFTFKNLTKHGESTKDVIMNGTVYIDAFQYRYETSPSHLKLKIEGDEVYSISLCSRYSWNLHSDDKVDSYTYVPERKVKVKMDKKSTVYVSFNFIDKCDVELNVKKK